MDELSLKFCIVGESGVGKSAIINRLVNKAFSDSMDITVGVNVNHHNLNLKGRPVRNFELSAEPSASESEGEAGEELRVWMLRIR
jgi:GTPase SAR1 family protein